MLNIYVKKRKEVTKLEKRQALFFVPEHGNIQRLLRYGEDEDIVTLAKYNNKVIGVATADFASEPDDPDFNIYVKSDFRRKGIGSKLIRAFYKKVSYDGPIDIHRTELGEPFYKKVLGHDSYCMKRTDCIDIKTTIRFLNPLTFRQVSVAYALRAYHPNSLPAKMAKHLLKRNK